MHRRSLIKCILGLAAAPKILAELDFKPPVVAKVGNSAALLSDLNFLIPKYYKTYVEKYGDGNWVLSADVFQATWNKAQLNYLEDKLQLNGNETKSS